MEDERKVMMNNKAGEFMWKSISRDTQTYSEPAMSNGLTIAFFGQTASVDPEQCS